VPGWTLSSYRPVSSVWVVAMTRFPRNAWTIAPAMTWVAGTPGRARGEIGPAATVPVTSEAARPAVGPLATAGHGQPRDGDKGDEPGAESHIH